MTSTQNRLQLADLFTASTDRLNEELAATGSDCIGAYRFKLVEAVVRLMHRDYGPFDLLDEAGNVIREATAEETAESVLAGPEGWIEVDGQRCYVSE